MKTKLICPFNKMATKKFGISEDNWGYLKIALTKWIDCVMTGFYIYINKLIAVDVGNSNMAKADKKMTASNHVVWIGCNYVLNFFLVIINGYIISFGNAFCKT